MSNILGLLFFGHLLSFLYLVSSTYLFIVCFWALAFGSIFLLAHANLPSIIQYFVGLGLLAVPILLFYSVLLEFSCWGNNTVSRMYVCMCIARYNNVYLEIHANHFIYSIPRKDHIYIN